MKKILFAMLFSVGTELSAMASDMDMLVWQIDLTDSWVYEGSETLPSFNKINAWLQSGDNIVRLEPLTYTTADHSSVYDVTVDPPVITGGIDPDGYTTTYATDLTNYSNDDYGGYELMMQLWFNDTLVSVSENLYDSSKHIYLSALARTMVTSDMDPSNMFASINQLGGRMVPEPTSGLLMMLGAGLLALRRRRRA